MLPTVLILALLGSIIGGFASVVTWRLPRGKSIFWPSNHCHTCRNKIVLYNNIPLVGWLRLNGKCRHCQDRIPIRYPLIEGVSSLIWITMSVFVWNQASYNHIHIVGSIILSFLLFCIAIIDIEHMNIPEGMCIFGIISGIIITGLNYLIYGQEDLYSMINNHLLAVFGALITMESISLVGKKIVGSEILGLGDAKLAAMGAAWLGMYGLTVAMALAIMSAGMFGFVGRVTKYLKPLQPYPFAPFIALGIWSSWIYFGIRF